MRYVFRSYLLKLAVWELSAGFLLAQEPPPDPLSELDRLDHDTVILWTQSRDRPSPPICDLSRDYRASELVFFCAVHVSGDDESIGLDLVDSILAIHDCGAFARSLRILDLAIRWDLRPRTSGYGRAFCLGGATDVGRCFTSRTLFLRLGADLSCAGGIESSCIRTFRQLDQVGATCPVPDANVCCNADVVGKKTTRQFVTEGEVCRDRSRLTRRISTAPSGREQRYKSMLTVWLERRLSAVSVVRNQSFLGHDIKRCN